MDFNKENVQNLRGMRQQEIAKSIRELLLEDEPVLGAYKTVRDQVVFTDRRIITADLQGVTGTRQELFVLPYARIQYFGLRTAGFGDPMQDTELTVFFADGQQASFGFWGGGEILQIGQAISRWTMR